MPDNRRFGEQNGRCKLPDNAIRMIRLNPNKLSQAKLAAFHGVHKRTIQRIQSYELRPFVK